MKLLLAFSFCCVQFVCNAQWQKVGPYGGPDNPFTDGTSLCFASMGKKLFTGTLSGLYISNDNGKEWDQMEELPLRQVKDIKTNAGRIFIYYEDSGFYISDNAGISWEIASPLLQKSEIEQICFYHAEVYIIYKEKQIFCSPDNGKNWKMIFPGGDADTMNSHRSILCVNKNGNNIYIGGYVKLLVSKDNGQTWRSIYSNLPVFQKGTKGPSYFDIRDIFFLDSAIFIKNHYQTYYSADQGKKWTLVKDMGYNHHFYTHMMVYQNKVICASADGILEFDRLGNTWKPSIEIKDKILFNDSAWFGYFHKSFFSSGQNLFIQNDNGLFISSSGGVLWAPTSLELDKYADSRTQLILTDQNYILFKTYKGLFLSADHGLSIQKINFGWKHTNISSIWTKDSIVIAGGIQNKTFISKNHGLHWNELITGRESGSGCKAEFIVIQKDIYFINICGQLYRSVTDKNKKQTYKRIMNQFGVYAMKDSLIYAGINTYLSGEGDKTYVAVSADYGQHWNKVYNNVPSNKINTIITGGKNIIIGTDKGIYIASGDPKTAKWKRTYNDVYGIEVLARLDSCIIAGTSHNGVLISFNDGLSWKTCNKGLPSDTRFFPNSISRIIALSTYGHHVFAATDHGIYLLKYGDKSWINITGHVNDRIQTVAADNIYLYIGTENNGVMRRPLSEVLGME